MANLFSKKIKGEEHRPMLQSVSFSDGNQSIAALKKNQLDTYDELESYKRLRKKRKKIAFARMAVWFLIILFVPVFVFFSIVIINPKAGCNFFGYNFYYVTSRSMTGVCDKHSCIMVKSVHSTSQVQIGTDITFIRELDGQVVTHRVIDILEDEQGKISYITKGVANTNADQGSVAFENVIGIRMKTLNGLGALITYFRTPYGIVSFLAIFVGIAVAFNIGLNLSDDIRAVGRTN